MRHFKYSFLVTVAGLVAAFLWGGPAGLFIAAILGVLEISLSFDNAVVNASVLKDMDPKWQARFLTWGILIAVFGMRLVFPVAIVAIVADIGILEVTQMALNDPDAYSAHLLASHVDISAFGGMFLLMVFLSFLLDETKELHWWGLVEEKLAGIGKLESIEIVIALGVLWALQSFLPPEEKLDAMLAGISGVMLFVIVGSASGLFEVEETGEAVTHAAKRSGVMGFLYLEVLDASFSFDGVIGAFAISKDVIIIMLGLAIGAMFVRSITVYLVRKGTLSEYVFLEHGAHYAIGALALIMLASTKVHIPEVVTGLIGAAFIGLSLLSSIRYRNKH
ncbi:Protein of unknown function DUF475 [Nitrosococcus oceani ATCC 19707]|uniref:Integral membrane protein n=3 Tax=Nitrosococcus oceani TaxID=1229 RepID=Q3JCD1_NITOC|nr:DUF475 domain-containing protein [Nitrosococcus oceani]ABA57515.1 Protein of unknown function DUF475 [Nitrosococcus oceani ATCC 19707]EDZ67810.1 conserved hypothetical protein [Nitrosococcus oceani AFC27]KFI20015.1 hypothetical protein IB75_05165 [Nitrosococcus oceani C-27]GEM20695.1 hypothetical protein NONS58_21140 [Nitrosococcus oceani]